jgi:hypothetical protein
LQVAICNLQDASRIIKMQVACCKLQVAFD